MWHPGDNKGKDWSHHFSTWPSFRLGHVKKNDAEAIFIVAFVKSSEREFFAVAVALSQTHTGLKFTDLSPYCKCSAAAEGKKVAFGK